MSTTIHELALSIDTEVSCFFFRCLRNMFYVYYMKYWFPFNYP